MSDPAPPPAAAAPAPAAVGEPVIEADPALEADGAADDGDSAFGDAVSSTASITSSILRYREENGRTYHAYKDGQYVIPNDDRELDRLDLQHHVFLLTFENKLYLSPAGSDGKPIKRVLDVGTGTGIWAIDFADDHPESTVIGVDLSPSQPQFVPPNVTFQVDDLEEPWTFNAKFDFIYSRMMTASFADWPRFFQRCFDNLEPGGWLELADIVPAVSDDGTLSPDTAFHKWLADLLQGTQAIGRSFDGAKLYKQQLEDAGFVNVTEVVYRWPMNQWPRDRKYKELGMWTLENIGSGVEGLSMAVFTRVLQWSKEATDLLLVDVRKDMKNKAIHAYWPIHVVYGQKPE